jgi:hypothetical protein
MAITRESIETKLKGLKEQLEQLKGNANAIAGAISITEQFLADFDTPEVQIEEQ